jgi:hypothetical protein
MKKNYIPSAILEKIKNDVKLELSINYSDNIIHVSRDPMKTRKVLSCMLHGYHSDNKKQKNYYFIYFRRYDF